MLSREEDIENGEVLECISNLENQLVELLDERLAAEGDNVGREMSEKSYETRKDEIITSFDRVFEYYNFQQNSQSRLEEELDGLRDLEQDLRFQLEILGKRFEQAKEEHGKPLPHLPSIEEMLKTPPEIVDLLLKVEEAELRKTIRSIIESSEYSMRLDELENDPELLLRKGDLISYWYWLLWKHALSDEIRKAVLPLEESGADAESCVDMDSRVCFNLSKFDENGKALHFKTRYKGVTVTVCFELVRNVTDIGNTTERVLVSTDVHIPGTEELGKEFFRPNFHPCEFIKKSLWPLIEPRCKVRMDFLGIKEGTVGTDTPGIEKNTIVLSQESPDVGEDKNEKQEKALNDPVETILGQNEEDLEVAQSIES